MKLLVLLLLAACVAPEPEPVDPPPNRRLVDAIEHPDTELPPARDLWLARVTLNQGTRATLMVAGEDREPEVPVVPGKDGLVRAFVSPLDGWTEHPVRGVLTVLGADRSWILTSEISPTGPSHDADLDSTLSWTIPAEAMQPGVRVAVSLRELEPGPGGTIEDTTWPVEGTRELDLEEWGGVLRVVIIPIRYLADGSGRLPDTSPEQLQLISDYLLRLYPLREIDVEVQEPWDIEREMLADGTGWTDTLDELASLRSQRGVGWADYAYALMAPSDSWSSYCLAGCQAGLSYRVDNPNTSWRRASMGLGFSGIRAAETMAHELGHAHGQRHAPCGDPSNVDPDYPYSNGSLGDWGWNGEFLVDPGGSFDIMGYCQPKWISDYTTNELQGRLAMIEGLLAGREEREAPSTWRSALLRDDGSLQVGDVVERVAGGEPWELTWEDGSGNTHDLEGWFAPFAHGSGGTLLLPDVAGRVRLPDGRGLEL